jgi:predicted regulator of Ras-like GTPase activity (Roadblock/LC7/MglB family)
VTAFGRDYQNPWLVRGMVDSGHRLRNGAALAELAQQVGRDSAAGSADSGAALCVLAYRLLEQDSAPAVQVAEMDQRIGAYLQAGPTTPHAKRWSLSLLFVLGRLWLEHGDLARARNALQRCVAMDVIGFSPLLCNRVVEAHLILGSLDIAQGARAAAAAQWRTGIQLAHRAVTGDWRNALGDIEHPAEFGLPELASILEYASACAFALAHIDDVQSKHWWWLHPRRDRLSQSRKTAKALQHAQLGLRSVQAELQNYVHQADNFVQQLQRSEAERGGLQTVVEHQGRELDAYRTQTDEYVRRITAVEAHALQKEAELAQQALLAQVQAEQIAAQQNELNSYRVQAQQMLEQINAKQDELGSYRLQAQQMSEQITMQQNQLSSASLAAQELAQSLSSLQAELLRSRDQQAQCTDQVSELTQRLALREQELQLMCQSASWQVTRPLRFLSASLKRGQP